MLMQGHGFRAGLLDIYLKMIHEVLTHLWAIDQGLDANRMQVCRWTNTRQHEQLGRIDGSRAQQYFFIGGQTLGFAAQQQVHCHCSVVLQLNSLNLRLGQHAQIFALHDGPQV